MENTHTSDSEVTTYAAADFPPVTSGSVAIEGRVVNGVTAISFDTIHISEGVLHAHGRGTEPSKVVATGSASVHVYGNVIVYAADKARVYSHDGPHVSVNGEATAHAFGSGYVVTADTSSARVYGGVRAVATSASGIEAHDEAVVEGVDMARVSLHERAVGVIRGAATVNTHDQSRAMLFNTATGNVYGGHVDGYNNANVDIFVDSEHINAEGPHAVVFINGDREAVGKVTMHNGRTISVTSDEPAEEVAAADQVPASVEEPAAPVEDFTPAFALPTPPAPVEETAPPAPALDIPTAPSSHEEPAVEEAEAEGVLDETTSPAPALDIPSFEPDPVAEDAVEETEPAAPALDLPSFSAPTDTSVSLTDLMFTPPAEENSAPDAPAPVNEEPAPVVDTTPPAPASALITSDRSGVDTDNVAQDDAGAGSVECSVEPVSPADRVDNADAIPQLEKLGWTVVTSPTGAYQPFEPVDLGKAIEDEDKKSGPSAQAAADAGSQVKSAPKGFTLPTANDEPAGFTIPGLSTPLN